MYVLALRHRKQKPPASSPALQQALRNPCNGHISVTAVVQGPCTIHKLHSDFFFFK